MTLTPVQQKFILHWGEMGTRWGINRTVAQIHALLFLSPSPLHAEALAESLERVGYECVRATSGSAGLPARAEAPRDRWVYARCPNRTGGAR